MPRTKLKKTTAKRKNSTTEEDKYALFSAELEKAEAACMTEFEYMQDQTFGKILENIQNIRSKLAPHILSLTVGEMQNLLTENVRTFEQYNEIHAQNNRPLGGSNSTILGSRSVRAASRNDDGYSTGDSITSDVSRIGTSSARALGPFASAKAKSRRRSRSVSNVLNQSKQVPRTQPIANRNPSRQSRTRFRTPVGNRIQAMSADRCMGPVTPKVQVGQSMAMLRYARQGETVISLGGSPVIASSVIGSRANINIPVANGVFTIQPSQYGVVDANIISQMNPETLNELRQLQDNLDLIMQIAADSGNLD